MPRGHRRRPDVGRLGVLLGQGPEHQGRAVPGRAAVPERARPRRTAAAPARGFSSIDFDGDGLTHARGVPRLALHGQRVRRLEGAAALDLESPLGYSDGTKFSRVERDARRPGLARSGSAPDYGLPNPALAIPGDLQPARRRAPGATTSATRTRDGLANWLESARGPGSRAGGRASGTPDSIKVEPWAEAGDVLRPAQFGDFNERPFAAARHGRPRRRRRHAARRRGRPGQRRLSQHPRALRDRAYDLRRRRRLHLRWRSPTRACDMDPGPGVDPLAASTPFNPCAPNPDSRTCHDCMPFELSPSQQFLLQPGARTLVSRVWAPCLCAS